MEKKSVIDVGKMVNKMGSVYKLVIIAAKRALELSEGSPRLVEAGAKEKPALVALREIAAGKVSLRLKKPIKG